MKNSILVVGGTGLIGGAAALHLAALGHKVTLAARHHPAAPPLAALPFCRGSYVGDDISNATLARFDTLIFAAANDGRQLPANTDEWSYFRRANVQGVPAFLTRARAAGVKKAIYISSFYPDVLPPEMIAGSGYLSSRVETDRKVLALAGQAFSVCVLRAPHVIGYVPGLSVPVIEMVIRYLRGDIGGTGQRFAFPGGSNYMSTRSFSEAVAGAIKRGESGIAYLLGDQNISYAEYFDTIRQAMDLPDEVATLDRDHPVLPNGSLVTMRNMTIDYEPDPETVALLGYRRDDALPMMREMTAYYLPQIVATGEGRASGAASDTSGPVSRVEVMQPLPRMTPGMPTE